MRNVKLVTDKAVVHVHMDGSFVAEVTVTPTTAWGKLRKLFGAKVVFYTSTLPAMEIKLKELRWV